MRRLRKADDGRSDTGFYIRLMVSDLIMYLYRSEVPLIGSFREHVISFTKHLSDDSDLQQTWWDQYYYPPLIHWDSRSQLLNYERDI